MLATGNGLNPVGSKVSAITVVKNAILFGSIYGVF